MENSLVRVILAAAAGASVVLLLLAPYVHSIVTSGDENRVADSPKLYIVYMGRNTHPSVEATHEAHHNMLRSHVFESDEEARDCLVHHYKYTFNGFSAMLRPSQAAILRKTPDVVSVVESEISQVHTTHSWSYLGLKETSGVWPSTSFGEDVIIGVLDSGYWPESKSFSDDGMSDIPARWKGTCQEGEQFNPRVHCNKKVIGARWFIEGYEASTNTSSDPALVRTARDVAGHGTHTASTAAGARVQHADFFGLAPGTAVGGAPSARLAIYKVCWTLGCTGADILAAFDQAVADGVDVVSMSLGSVPTGELNGLELAAYHAAVNGILVTQSAGNDGPGPFTVSSSAPWILTVGATSTDREFKADLRLGDGTLLQGYALHTTTVFPEREYPIISGASIPAKGRSSNESRFCLPNTLDRARGAGRVIICEQTDTIGFDGIPIREGVDGPVEKIGGAGVIVVDDSQYTLGYPFELRYLTYGSSIPAINLDHKRAKVIDTYLKRWEIASPGTKLGWGECMYITSNAAKHTATIKQPITVINADHNTFIASFSSRGPNLVTPDIIKPDLTAPGLNILAAWNENIFDSISKFVVISGTSMACPHVAAAAALIKAKHRKWSPAAIKSALMTTANPLKKETPLAWGSGEINITRAVDPGLVYDLRGSEYATFLCGLGFSDQQYKAITGQPLTTCPNPPPPASQLNYPSISVGVSSVVNRTVTNVGPPASTYRAQVQSAIPGVTIRVEPKTLTFTKVGEKKSFKVFIEIMQDRAASNAFTFLTWSDGSGHIVTSPIYIQN